MEKGEIVMESVVWHDSVLPSLAGDYLVCFADGSLAVCPYLAKSYRFDTKAEVIPSGFF